jgi:cytochrome oxidase Cu insertion factor (SCO1/SenC/PrrC family)
MADTQTAPQAPAGLQPPPAPQGSVTEAQEALLSLLEPEEDKPETEEAKPTEEEESQPVEEDESFEEESEEEAEEESEEESEETDGEEEELYAVTVNGEEVAVSLDELLSGYSRQSDYTRKTQEVANDRKEMEALQQQYNSEVQQIQQERQQYMEALTNIIAGQGSELEKFANINWDELRETDPIEYVTTRERYRETQERIQSMQHQQAQTAQVQQAQMNQARQEMLKVERGKLVEALPEWDEPGTQKELANTLQTYAKTQGFTQEELTELIDHRSILVLLKAHKYDQLQKSDVKSKKLKNKPKLVRAGSGTSTKKSDKSKRTAQMKRLQGSGHIDDASALLEDFIDI